MTCVNCKENFFNKATIYDRAKESHSIFFDTLLNHRSN